MFAGLPGIGVGTLFYVLMAFWMPLREIPRVLQGTSSLATWKLIVQQMVYAAGIVATVMCAERLLLWVIRDSRAQPLSPATWVHSELGARATGSFLAAPITASFLLLVGVLLAVELLRVIHGRLAAKPVDSIEIRDTDRRRSPVEQPLEIG